ncbi:Pycsar system effector family protein [Streptomyces sp. CA-146814]|uniref:Pycsar system effector family protein n=1 Tax=Streptomyces sp. CA-146814 TaxID=3240053 RepID=UPI003D8F78D7
MSQTPLPSPTPPPEPPPDPSPEPPPTRTPSPEPPHPARPARTPDASAALDNAWRIHTSVAEWTGRVDVKASVVLTLEIAILAGLVTVSTEGDMRMTGVRLVLLLAGACLLVAAVVSAVLVLMPRMRARKVRDEVAADFVYFGHLRLWDPVRLAEALQQDVLPVVTRSIVVNSDIAWRKHWLLRLSIVLALAGGLPLLLALLLRR